MIPAEPAALVMRFSTIYICTSISISSSVIFLIESVGSMKATSTMTKCRDLSSGKMHGEGANLRNTQNDASILEPEARSQLNGVVLFDKE